MGSGISKHPDEVTSAGAGSSKPMSVSESTIDSTTTDGSNGNAEDKKTSGCPMHRADGTYSFDLASMFRAASVHGPKGSKPLSPEEIEKEKQASASTSGAAAGGGCPVRHGGNGKKPSPPPSSGCPVRHNNDGSRPEYNVYSQPIDKTNQMPTGVKNQLPSATQRVALSTERVSSTIPKGGGDDGEEKTWTYPSPQQFYNALVRKGKMNISQSGGDDNEQDDDGTENATEQDMESVVALHNNMNEKTWKKIVEWEQQIYSTSSSKPKLLRFEGRPHDLSPKAYIKHYLLGHPLPFDRHDWVILRDDNTTVRYIMDYYFNELAAKETADSAVPELHDESATSSLLVDVRPALDSPTMLFHRVITMPYKIYISKETNFTYMPMKGDKELSSQVGESIQVWQSIQQMKQDQDAQKQRKEQEVDTSEDSTMNIVLSKAQAEQVASNFARVLKQCQSVQERVQNCTNDTECQQASIDLTLCMGELLCPVQHQAFTKALMSDDSNSDRQEQLIEVSLETLSDCVVHCTAERQAAREQYPQVFK